MNSTKKGPCYGFRLQSLDSLSITKSSDKKQTLVHYLANLVNTKYPDLKGFATELKCIDKAAQFSLENILTDVRELEKGNLLPCIFTPELNKAGPGFEKKPTRSTYLRFG